MQTVVEKITCCFSDLTLKQLDLEKKLVVDTNLDKTIKTLFIYKYLLKDFECFDKIDAHVLSKINSICSCKDIAECSDCYTHIEIDSYVEDTSDYTESWYHDGYRCEQIQTIYVKGLSHCETENNTFGDNLQWRGIDKCFKTSAPYGSEWKPVLERCDISGWVGNDICIKTLAPLGTEWIALSENCERPVWKGDIRCELNMKLKRTDNCTNY
jgi:hypothetical protein